MIFLIYDCNQWQEYSSLRFIVAVDEEHLDQALSVIQKDRRYTDEEMSTYIYVESTVLNDLSEI